MSSFKDNINTIQNLNMFQHRSISLISDISDDNESAENNNNNNSNSNSNNNKQVIDDNNSLIDNDSDFNDDITFVDEDYLYECSPRTNKSTSISTIRTKVLANVIEFN